MKMTQEELIQFISGTKAVMVDEPFNRPANNNQVIFKAIRHAKNRRIFALVYRQDGHLYVDLKHNLEDIEELIEMSNDISQGRHFDKRHWITVNITKIVSKVELAKLVETSYQLTAS